MFDLERMSVNINEVTRTALLERSKETTSTRIAHYEHLDNLQKKVI